MSIIQISYVFYALHCQSLNYFFVENLNTNLKKLKEMRNKLLHLLQAIK